MRGHGSREIRQVWLARVEVPQDSGVFDNRPARVLAGELQACGIQVQSESLRPNRVYQLRRNHAIRDEIALVFDGICLED